MIEANDKSEIIDKADEAMNIIAQLSEKIRGRKCIFRGTSRKYSTKPDGISSSLYRWAHRAAKKKKINIGPDYLPFEMEEEIVSRAKKHAKKHFSSSSFSNLEIVTALRHFDGNVNVIDFSTDLYVALFFACVGDREKHGELIIMERGTREMSDINYGQLSSDPDQPVILDPPYNEANHSRVVAQKSIFVYSPRGYLRKKEECECYRVRKEIKQVMLDYLKRVHGIDRNVIYNDLIGFIQIEKSQEEAILLAYKGIAKTKPKGY